MLLGSGLPGSSAEKLLTGLGGQETGKIRRNSCEQMYGGNDISFGGGEAGVVEGLLLINRTSAGVTGELPAAKTCPNITSDTSSGATAALFRTSLMTAEPRSYTGTVDKAPLKEPRTEEDARAIQTAPTARGRQADRGFPPAQPPEAAH